MAAAPLSLIEGRAHYTEVISEVLAAKVSVWIATANLLGLMIEGASVGRRRRYRPVLAALAELAERGVELRLLHGAPPSRDAFDAHPILVRGGLSMRLCPRVRWKLVIVDGRTAYIGSANWTGAGLGVRSDRNRNFEMGILTTDESMIDRVQASFDAVWCGNPCADCGLRDRCEMPLDALEAHR